MFIKMWWLLSNQPPLLSYRTSGGIESTFLTGLFNGLDWNDRLTFTEKSRFFIFSPPYPASPCWLDIRADVEEMFFLENNGRIMMLYRRMHSGTALKNNFLFWLDLVRPIFYPLNSYCAERPSDSCYVFSSSPCFIFFGENALTRLICHIFISFLPIWDNRHHHVVAFFPLDTKDRVIQEK